MKIAIGCIALLAFAVFGILFNGYALSVLWSWFAVPIGLPSLGMAQCMSLGLLAHMLFGHIDTKKGNDKEMKDHITDIIGVVVIRPLFALVYGWVILQFIN